MVTNSPQNIAEKTVLISVKTGKPTLRRSVTSEIADTMADKKLLSISKRLLESNEFTAIQKIDNAIDSYVKARCLPLGFREGIHLLPEDLIIDVDAKLQELDKERKQLIAKFLDAYPERIQEAKKRLKDLFDATDYPSTDSLRESFYLEVRYLSLDTPTKLKSINASIFRREADKANKFWMQAAEEVQGALRASMAELVGHITERLSGEKNNGKPKTFRANTIKRMEEFLNLFKARNITNDEELSALVNKAKNALKGTDTKLLRSEQDLRERVGKAFGEIKEKLDTMIIDKPRRKISFEEE